MDRCRYVRMDVRMEIIPHVLQDIIRFGNASQKKGQSRKGLEKAATKIASKIPRHNRTCRKRAVATNGHSDRRGCGLFTRDHYHYASFRPLLHSLLLFFLLLLLLLPFLLRLSRFPFRFPFQ